MRTVCRSGLNSWVGYGIYHLDTLPPDAQASRYPTSLDTDPGRGTRDHGPGRDLAPEKTLPSSNFVGGRLLRTLTTTNSLRTDRSNLINPSISKQSGIFPKACTRYNKTGADHGGPGFESPKLSFLGLSLIFLYFF